MILEGRAWKVGDHVDTDAIIPARYLTSHRMEELAAHCLEDLLPGFASSVRCGDILVAGVNFGCGSSREHAPLALKHLGVGAVVAKGFARIFFRNAVNVGLAVVTCPDAADRVQQGHRLRLDLRSGLLANVTMKERFSVEPFPPFLLSLLEKGGLIPFLQEDRHQWTV